MSRLKPRNPPERSHGTLRECFDYSETHLSANGLGKTAPKLVSLPKRPRNRLTSRRASPGKAGPRSGRPASKAAATAGGGDSDQARLASPSALSTSTDATAKNVMPHACSSFSQATRPRSAEAFPRWLWTARPHLVEAPLEQGAVHMTRGNLAGCAGQAQPYAAASLV